MEILKLVLPCERKSSALEKKWKMKKFHFPKIERPGFGGLGGRFASFHKNDVIFGNVVYYSEKKTFFKSHICQKKKSKSSLEMQKLP